MMTSGTLWMENCSVIHSAMIGNVGDDGKQFRVHLKNCSVMVPASFIGGKWRFIGCVFENIKNGGGIQPGTMQSCSVVGCYFRNNQSAIFKNTIGHPAIPVYESVWERLYLKGNVFEPST